MNFWWHIRLPSLWDLMPGAEGDPSGSLYTTVAFPTARLLAWASLALAFPAATQVVFDRAEV